MTALPQITRVLWVFRHRTARYEEVNSILRAGAEVVPISGVLDAFPNAVELPEDQDPWTPPWRERCTIPPEPLRLVRDHDYFSGRALPPAVVDALNAWFDVVIVGTFSHVAFELLRRFRGHVVLRPYGGYAYSQKIGPRLLRHHRLNVVARSDRWHWVPAIPYQTLIEDSRLTRNETFLPACVSSERLASRWSGRDSDPVVAEVISLISTYRGETYRRFVSCYGSLAVRVFGQNPRGGERGDDDRIVGTLPDDAYHAALARTRVMLYEGLGSKYHLHYHALEALAMGLPVVFFERSALAHMALYDGFSLDQLRMLGMARTPGEAFSLARALVTDSSRAVELAEKQRPLRELFSPSRGDAIVAELLKRIVRDAAYRRAHREPTDIPHRSSIRGLANRVRSIFTRA